MLRVSSQSRSTANQQGQGMPSRTRTERRSGLLYTPKPNARKRDRFSIPLYFALI